MREIVKKIIACPKCKGDLDINEAEERIRCKRCKIEFKIKDGIPVLILD